MWGVGATDERAADPDRAAELPGETGNDIAAEMARERDPDWNADDDASWVRVVEADEDEVDALMVEDEVVVGCVSAPQLNRRWWAMKSGGAFTGKSLLRPTPCRVSDVSTTCR